MKVFLSLVLASFLAVGECASLGADAAGERLIIDPIIKAILESFRPKLANLTVENINETISNPNLNATIIFKDIKIQDADKFVIQKLKSSIVPLKLANLTLTWQRVRASAFYDVDAIVNIAKKPIKLQAKGNATATASNLYFTIGANMELKDKTIQVKPKGLFGFDVSVGSFNVTLGSLLGSEELGKMVATFLSEVIPGLVDDVKKPIFDAFHDDLVKIINQVLKNNGTNKMFDDERFDLENSDDLLSLMDLSEELAALGSDDFFESDEQPIDFEL